MGIICWEAIAQGFNWWAMYWKIVGIKHQHHVLRSVPGGRELFLMLPLVCGSVGAKIVVVVAAIDGRGSTGATVPMAEGAQEWEWEWEPEQDLWHCIKGASSEVAWAPEGLHVIQCYIPYVSYIILSNWKLTSLPSQTPTAFGGLFTASSCSSLLISSLSEITSLSWT